MSTETPVVQEDREIIGYGPAAEYVGLKPGTLSSYVSNGYGPEVAERRADGSSVRPVFLESELKRWLKDRPGQGARTDRMHAGSGRQCGPCEGACTVAIPA